MKKLLFLLLIVACTKEEPYTPIVPDHRANVVFWASRGGFQLSGNVVHYTVYASDKPTCDSYWDNKSKYLITWLKEGTYIIWVKTNQGDIARNITIHEKYCNTFDCANIYGWE